MTAKSFKVSEIRDCQKQAKDDGKTRDYLRALLFNVKSEVVFSTNLPTCENLIKYAPRFYEINTTPKEENLETGSQQNIFI